MIGQFKKNLLYILILSSMNIYGSEKAPKVMDTGILSDHPDLTKKAFGTDNPEELKKEGFIKKAFKKSVIECKEFTAIIAGSILAAVAYGIINDQITARICLEYFSQGFHRDMMMSWQTPIMKTLRSILVKTDSPTVYGFIWGTIATWWFGAILGIPAAIAARIGSPWLNAVDCKELIKPLIATMSGVATTGLMAGFWAYLKYNNNSDLIDSFRNYRGMSMIGVPENKAFGFIIDSYIHTAAYAGGAIGGLGLIGYIIYKRIKKIREKKKEDIKKQQLVYSH